LGGGIVTVPAAFVKGLVPITKKTEEPEEPDEVETDDEEEAARKKQESDARAMELALESAKTVTFAFLSEMEKKVSAFIKEPKTSVLPFTSINLSNMKPDIKSLKERLSKVTKIEELTEVVASVSPVLDAIVAESERQEAARVEAEAQNAKIEAAKAQAVATAEQVTKELEVVKAELAQIKAAQAAVAAEQAFQNRMASIDEVFELDNDERAEIVADIKDLSDEAFAKWMDKSKKLMKEKMKTEKKKKADEAKAAQDAMLAKLAEKGVKLTDAGVDVSEIIASAQSNPTSTAAGTVVIPVGNDLNTLAKSAMAGMSIGGKKIADIK
jgi:hypothetical protein